MRWRITPFCTALPTARSASAIGTSRAIAWPASLSASGCARCSRRASVRVARSRRLERPTPRAPPAPRRKRPPRTDTFGFHGLTGKFKALREGGSAKQTPENAQSTLCGPAAKTVRETPINLAAAAPFNLIGQSEVENQNGNPDEDRGHRGQRPDRL